MACYVLLPPFDIVGTVWDGRMTLIGCECATSQVSFLLPAHHHLWRSGWTPMKSPPEPVQQLSAVRAAVNKDSEENPSRAWNPGSTGIQGQRQEKPSLQGQRQSPVNPHMFPTWGSRDWTGIGGECLACWNVEIYIKVNSKDLSSEL